jgi:hypothetical protein
MDISPFQGFLLIAPSITNNAIQVKVIVELVNGGGGELISPL